MGALRERKAEDEDDPDDAFEPLKAMPESLECLGIAAKPVGDMSRLEAVWSR